MNRLSDVAAQWCLAEGMKEPERWLTRQIKSGRFRARRIGRHWMMTDADVAYNLDRLANVVAGSEAPQPDSDGSESTVGVPSLASMRRRRSA